MKGPEGIAHKVKNYKVSHYSSFHSSTVIFRSMIPSTYRIIIRS